MQRHRAFTLVEVLVTVACIGLLAALTIMAVQAAREASRRTLCANNLRQIGLALTAYETREGVFPSAMPKDQSGRALSDYSPMVRILPELEMAPLFNQINFSVNQPTRGVALENNTAASCALAVFLCPSDGGGWRSGTGMNNYRANMGAGVDSFPRPAQRGAFQLEVWKSPASFTDGLSTTALVSERLRGDGNGARWDPQRDYWFADSHATTVDGMVSDCSRPLGVDPPHYSASGATWLLFGYDQSFYNHVIPPNSANPDCSPNDIGEKIAGGEDVGIHTARSYHYGRANMVSADGSVHFIKLLASLPVPLPQHYLLGFDDQMYDIDSGSMYKYLAGELRRGDGWYHYYLYYLAVKTPIGTIALIALAAWLAVMRLHCRGDLMDEAAVAIPAAAFFLAVSSQTGLNFGRYVGCAPYLGPP